MTNRQYLEDVSKMDELIEHTDDCGHCAHQIILAATARDYLARDEIVDPKTFWDEAKRRWQETKYFKYWQDEKAAGRDPNESFKKKGWEP